MPKIKTSDIQTSLGAVLAEVGDVIRCKSLEETEEEAPVFTIEHTDIGGFIWFVGAGRGKPEYCTLLYREGSPELTHEDYRGDV